MSTTRPSRIDRDTAERLLEGVPAVRDPGGVPLANLLAAAAAPGRPDELAGEQAALAAFRAAQLAHTPEPRRPSVLKTALAKMLTVKAAAAAAAVVAVGGGVAVAAETGALPNPLTAVQGQPSASPDVDKSKAADGTEHAKGTPSPSLVGLCHAYLAGAGSAEHSHALENPAFTVLITTAGGKDKVDAYCTNLLASAHPEPSHKPGTHPSGQPSVRPTGTHSTTESHPTGEPSAHPSH
ncbi:MAG TPA: hypothetical protein VF054_00545 [Micromonosporaceae bacterium]